MFNNIFCDTKKCFRTVKKVELEILCYSHMKFMFMIKPFISSFIFKEES